MDPTFSLKRVHVAELFGEYTYDLPAEKDYIDSQFSILYGDNGAGKTTLLKLIHNVISKHPKRGHKTNIAKTIFKSFRLDFSSDLQISVYRPKAESGNFEIELNKGSDTLAKARYVAVDNRVAVEDSTLEQEEFEATVDAFIHVNSYFLGDDRTLESDVFSSSTSWEMDRASKASLEYRLMRMNGGYDDLPSLREVQLDLALSRAQQWVNSSALSGATVGSQNSNHIYTNLVRDLAIEPDTQATMLDPGVVKSTIKILRDLSFRASKQARFGLSTDFDSEEMISSIESASQDRRLLIINLLQPFIEGTKARLDALEDVYSLLQKVVDSLNHFFIRKTASFDLRRGFTFQSLSGRSIPPAGLSSGEKQLLTLLCNLISARHQDSIFLVDEPELSLNVKWQRELVPALLSCIEGSTTQLILATHSIELLSRYTDNVIRLPSGE